jgi:hypothetical protein
MISMKTYLTERFRYLFRRQSTAFMMALLSMRRRTRKANRFFLYGLSVIAAYFRAQNVLPSMRSMSRRIWSGTVCGLLVL